jgi:hypothetical protein
MHAVALEIFLGLIWLDYTDNPQEEQHPGGVLRRQAQGSDA